MHPRAGVDNAIAGYEEFVEAEGHITPASASVIASYLMSKGIESIGLMRLLGNQYDVDPEDIERDFNRQQNEKAAAGGLSQEVPHLTPRRRSSWQVRKQKELGESMLRIRKNQLKRIIKEAVNPAYGPEVPLLPNGTVDYNRMTDEDSDHYDEGFEDGSIGEEPRDTMSLRQIADKPRVDQMYDAGYSDGIKQFKKKTPSKNYRTPTEEESGVPDSQRSVIHNRRPDW